jgi:hypothetical protein
MAAGENMSLIQGVSYSSYGDPICVAVIDCGAAGAEQVHASIKNVQSGRVFEGVVLKEICSNPGVFFGCVDTAYQTLTSPDPIPADIVVGEFGDELRIQYNSSSPIDGHIRHFHHSSMYPVVLCIFWSCLTFGRC